MMTPITRCFAAAGVAMLLAAGVGGCASTRGLSAHGTLVAPASLHAGRSLAADAAQGEGKGPSPEWWKHFDDPQLDALVDEALAGNPDLALAIARARGAAAAAGAANAERLPTLGAGTSAAGAKIPGSAIPAPIGGHFAIFRYGYLSFRWGIDWTGERRDAWAAALGAARAAAIDSDAARILLTANVVQAYITLQGAYRLHDLDEQDVARDKELLSLTTQRAKAGIDSDFQLVQIRGEAAAARATATAGRHEVERAGVALAVLLGKGPDRALSIARPEPLPDTAVPVPTAVTADLIGKRPDVVAARWRVEAAGKGVAAARAAFLPNIDVSALAGLIAGPGSSLLRASSFGYQAAPAISLPIFDGGRLRAGLSARNADWDEAVALYDKTVIAAINEIAMDHDALRTLDAQFGDARLAFDSARHAWDLAMQRYRGGIGSYLEALSVREQLIAAERALARLEIARASAAVALIESLGGGYSPDADARALVAAPAADIGSRTP